MKLTVKAYAQKFDISVQAVYQQLNKGTLKSIEENGKKYVVVDNESVKPSLKPGVENVESKFNPMFRIVERLQKQLKAKDKEIKRLTRRLEKCNDKKAKVLVRYINELKQSQIEYKQEQHINKEEDAIEAEVESDKLTKQEKLILKVLIRRKKNGKLSKTEKKRYKELKDRE